MDCLPYRVLRAQTPYFGRMTIAPNPKSTPERVPQPRGKIQHQTFTSLHATRATCHQKAAATADKIDNSGTAQAQPKQSPVQLAPAKAANKPNGLRMACPWPPDQIQLQSPPQRRQRFQPSAQISFRFFPAVTTTSSTGLPVRSVCVLPAGSTVH